MLPQPPATETRLTRSAQGRVSSLRTPAYEALIARLKAETAARQIEKSSRR